MIMYMYFNYKYELSNQDWYLDTCHLMGKARLKGQINLTCSSGQSSVELCEISILIVYRHMKHYQMMLYVSCLE